MLSVSHITSGIRLNRLQRKGIKFSQINFLYAIPDLCNVQMLLSAIPTTLLVAEKALQTVFILVDTIWLLILFYLFILYIYIFLQCYFAQSFGLIKYESTSCKEGLQFHSQDIGS